MHQAATRVTGSPESSFEVCMSQQTDSKAQYAITRHSWAASLFLLLHISSLSPVSGISLLYLPLALTQQVTLY